MSKQLSLFVPEFFGLKEHEEFANYCNSLNEKLVYCSSGADRLGNFMKIEAYGNDGIVAVWRNVQKGKMKNGK